MRSIQVHQTGRRRRWVFIRSVLGKRGVGGGRGAQRELFRPSQGRAWPFTAPKRRTPAHKSSAPRRMPWLCSSPQPTLSPPWPRSPASGGGERQPFSQPGRPPSAQRVQPGRERVTVEGRTEWPSQCGGGHPSHRLVTHPPQKQPGCTSHTHAPARKGYADDGEARIVPSGVLRGSCARLREKQPEDPESRKCLL